MIRRELASGAACGFRPVRPTAGALALCALLVAGCGPRRTPTSVAYPGHGPNPDLRNLLAAHSGAAGTPLDDCRLCHVETKREGYAEDSCESCHRALKEGAPAAATLNAYGRQYATLGRTRSAIRSLDGRDPDGDGVPSRREIDSGSFPGEAASVPGLPDAPALVLDGKALSALPRHRQFLLMNATTHADAYSTYEGWTVRDVLAAASVPLDAMTAITVFASDGYRVTLSQEEVLGPYPEGRFLPEALGAAAGCPDLVRAGQPVPEGVREGALIPGAPRLLLATHRDGTPLERSRRDERGRRRGEGPYRLIVPQKTAGAPDRPQGGPQGCPAPFDPSADHNAGRSVRFVVAIEVHPLPAGTRAPDWRRMAEKLLETESVLVFGCLRQGGVP